jgi:hypothetical protein
MSYYPSVVWQHVVTSTSDFLGTPSLTIGPNDSVYFAASQRGTASFNSFSMGGSAGYQILVGGFDSSGNPRWLLQDPRMNGGGDTEPVIAFGESDELYVAYTTIGATPTNKNQQNVFSLCGNCSILKGPEDLVVARIDGISGSSPTVTWVLQDAKLNSCARESHPCIVYDRFQKRLLVAYQSTGATLCQARVGSPNIVVASLSTDGALGWATQNNSLNSGGQNTAPKISVDSSGNIYLAYVVGAQVSGGGPFVGDTDIEVVRMHVEQAGCSTTVVRDWILSSSGVINTPVGDREPDIFFDTNLNLLFLTFITDGTVPGGIKSVADSNLVVASISPSGEIIQLLQSPLFNDVAFQYKTIDNPAITVDKDQIVYIAAHAVQADGNSMVLVFAVLAQLEGGLTRWVYQCGYKTYRAYIPAASGFTPPRSIYSTSGASFSSPDLVTNGGNLYMSFVKQDTNELTVAALVQSGQYVDLTAFQYMLDTSICSVCND